MGKSTRKITNRKKYNQALVNRGSLTFWLDEKAIDAWQCQEHHGGRGRGFQFSDTAIETALMLKGIFGLSLRATEGFINSLFGLMDMPLRSPDYSCISKRAKTVEVKYRNLSRGPVAHLVVDADTHEVVSAVVSLVNVADNEALLTLLNPLRRRIEQVSADGAYDTKECHRVLQRKGVKPTIVPRSNAGYWEDGHPRNDAVKALKSGELKQWKKDNDYHQRSLSETGMYRYKQLNSPKLTLRDYNAQVGEALAGVKAMNKVIGLGMPVRAVVN